MTKRSLYRLFALLLAFVLVAAACGSDDGDETSSSGSEADTEAEADGEGDQTVEAGTEAEGDVDTEVEQDTESVRTAGGSIAVGLEAEAQGLRPWEDTASSPVYNMMITVFDKLVEQKLDGTYDGWLATDITPNEDFTVWVMNLREGVTFHNGVELTAQTIADMFPIQQEGSQSSSQIAASNLVSVEATGDLEVTYTLSQSNSAFPAFLGRAQLGFVFEPGAAADSDAFNEAPVGTGPFLFEARDLDNE
ncbi:MAG: ABC transporter substrate-binding protein, partial [Actinomycetota bacterium]